VSKPLQERLEDEVERLREENERLAKLMQEIDQHRERLVEENERLRDESPRCAHCQMHLQYTGQDHRCTKDHKPDCDILTTRDGWNADCTCGGEPKVAERDMVWNDYDMLEPGSGKGEE
jgi:hypothetical protein